VRQPSWGRFEGIGSVPIMEIISRRGHVATGGLLYFAST